MAVINIDRGSLQAEFFSSSAKWTLESAPVRYGRGPLRPTRQANPVAGHPFDSNSVKTSLAVPRGAVTLQSSTTQSSDFTDFAISVHTRAQLQMRKSRAHARK